MERFDEMFDSFSRVYSKIEGIMADVYQDLQREPDNIDKAILLDRLGSVALEVLDSQMEFVDSYCSFDNKYNLLSSLDDKYKNLSNSLAEDRSKRM